MKREHALEDFAKSAPEIIEGAARYHREEERRACAALARAEGCICKDLIRWGAFTGESKTDRNLIWTLIRHDSRCPEALAAAIEARSKP